MAETTTSLYVKNVDQEKFIRFFEMKASGYIEPCEENENNWELCSYMEEGYGGHFWEGFSIAMMAVFPGIVFKGSNSLYWDDHCLHTSFCCDGKELTLKRSVELPCDCVDPEELDEEELAEYEEELAEYEEELAEYEEEREWFEADYDIPYEKKFSADEIATCYAISKGIDDVPAESDVLDKLLAAKCAEHHMAYERFTEISAIFVYAQQ